MGLQWFKRPVLAGSTYASGSSAWSPDTRVGMARGRFTGSTATNINAFGITTIAGVTSTAQYTLNDPIPGVDVTLICTSATTSQRAQVYLNTTTVQFQSSDTSTGTMRTMTFERGGAITLVGASSALYAVMGPGAYSTAYCAFSSSG